MPFFGGVCLLFICVSIFCGCTFSALFSFSISIREESLASETSPCIICFDLCFVFCMFAIFVFVYTLVFTSTCIQGRGRSGLRFRDISLHDLSSTPHYRGQEEIGLPPSLLFLLLLLLLLLKKQYKKMHKNVTYTQKTKVLLQTKVKGNGKRYNNMICFTNNASKMYLYS